jgi:N-acetyl sugar amidotransferase
MPDTKPGVVLDKKGVCQACYRYESRKKINWMGRYNKLRRLCDHYRRKDDYYDCVIAVSGGKDSYFQVKTMKELDMNPLLVTANTVFSWTDAGRHNIRNMGDYFGCDIISLDMNLKVARQMTRVGFEEDGFGSMPMDLAIYVFPIRVAINYKIPLVVYGENVSYEYGGIQNKETCSALNQIYNTVANPIDLEYWEERGISQKDLNSLIYPTKDEIRRAKVDPIYLSFFIPWDGFDNYQSALKCGFKDLSKEWHRKGYIENYDQIDTFGYLMNAWLKYPKYGFQRTTDVACYLIRSGRITRDDAVEPVRKYDHLLDIRILEDWLDFTGYTKEEFEKILERFWNRDIFKKVDGVWRLKTQVKKEKFVDIEDKTKIVKRWWKD